MAKITTWDDIFNGDFDDLTRLRSMVTVQHCINQHYSKYTK